IPDPDEQAEALTGLAGAQHDVGPLPGLREAAARIEDTQARRHALRSIAMASSDRGDSQGMQEAIATLPSEEERASVLREIDGIQSLKSLATGAPRTEGPTDGPLKSVSSWTTLAMAEFRNGKLPSARSHLRSAKRAADAVAKEHRDDAWRLVVEAEATLGDTGDATVSAEQIRDPSNRLWVLEEFVFGKQKSQLANRRQLRATALAMATAAAQLPEDAGPLQANASIRTIRLMFAARTLTDLGELAAAKQLASLIPEEPDWSRKSQALRYIANAQVQAGCVTDAIETLAAVRNMLSHATASSRAEGLQELARVQAALGDRNGAWAWSVALATPFEAARALLGIAEAQLAPAQIARLNSLPVVKTTTNLYGYTLGQRSREAPEAQAAITRYSEAIARNDKDAAAHAERGDAYVWLARYDLAIADYNRALELRPNAAIVHFDRGNILFQQQKYDAAIADYRNAIRLDGTYQAAYFMRGRVELAKGNTQRAIVDLTQAINLDAKHAHAYVERALAHNKQREYARAIADFDAAIRLNPFKAGYYNGRALVLLSMRKFPQALAETDLALALDPSNAYALDARGRAYEATGRREEALRAYRAALSLKPDLPDSVQGLKRLQELP